MEQELFFSGYCRQIDQSRMITALVTDGVLEEADCSFPHCIYAQSCPIAEKLQTLSAPAPQG